MWLLAPTTAPLVKLPSPQLMRMLLTVSVPGSTMAPRVRLYGLPSLTLAAPETVVVGSTLLTVTDVVYSLKPLSLSRIRPLTGKLPLSPNEQVVEVDVPEPAYVEPDRSPLVQL